MTRKPAFWAILSLLSAACAVSAFWLFPRAFPIVSLDIAMSREAALARARALAAERGWGPHGQARAAASFGADMTVQTFVELEGGGTTAFNRMLREGLYAPYSWQVRLFREGDANETTVRFTPEGRPFGFVERVPEDAERPSLEPEAARALAEKEATAYWQVDLGAHERVESGQERRPNGRVDHTFVYERSGATLGEGRYRLRLVVSGDRVTEVMPFVRVPQGFSRRYEEMRSANTAIGAAGAIGGGLLYLGLGCGVGLFVLLRRRALAARPAVVLATLVALAQVLADLNAWPLAWLDYDTALATRTFVLQSLVLIVAGGLAMGAVLAFSFMAAEGLSRLAFPGHPQLWRAWSRDAAPTPSMAGRTAGGYLMVPLDLVYVMGFYYVAGRWWGWWSPSEALLNPDSLAHYAPWFTPFAMALQAGVWEECLFRAVPIAGAALLGDRFGRRGLFIAVAFIVQAAIFGAGHAPYPAQPAYARPVELIVPSFVFGYLYLRYGLVPAVILHFVFDIVLMALPIFAASGAGTWIDQALVVLAALVPALVVAARRIQAGGWKELPSALRNAGWVPRQAVAPPAPPPPVAVVSAWPRWVVPALAAVAVATLPSAAWMLARTRPEVPRVQVSLAEAARAARAALDARGVTLPPGTKVLPSVVGGPGDEDRFVWQTAGRETYESLLGTWISPPRYRVRFARFEGDVAERADEWQVAIGTDGAARTVRHRVPEARAGASLDEPEARALAMSGLSRELGVDASTVREVSAVPSKLPARTDWTFTFADTVAPPLPQGERRLRLDLAGDEVVGAARYVHVPEDWERSQRATDATLGILSVIRGVLIAILLAVGGVAAVVAWSRGQVAARHVAAVVLVMLAAGWAALANAWPAIAAQFSTAQPFRLQAMLALVGGAVAQAAIAAVVALVVGVAARWRRAHTAAGTSQVFVRGVLLGAAAGGVSLLSAALSGHASPAWPSVSGAATLVPAASPVASGVSTYVVMTAVALLVFGAAEQLTAGWTRRRAVAAALLFLAGAILGGSASGGSVPAWALSAAVAGTVLVLAHVLVVRYDLAVVPGATAALGVLAMLPSLDRPYPGALPGTLLAVAAVALAGWWWCRALRHLEVEVRAEVPAAPE